MKLRRLIAAVMAAVLLLALAGCTLQIEITDPAALAILVNAGAAAQSRALDAPETDAGAISGEASDASAEPSGEANDVSTEASGEPGGASEETSGEANNVSAEASGETSGGSGDASAAGEAS